MEVQTYVCECGCNLEFKSDLGCEFQLGVRWLIVEDQFADAMQGPWRFYVGQGYKYWGQLREYIIKEKNRIPDEPVWLHLYNKYCNLSIPDNTKMMEDYIF